jgi:hypothetical protein
MTKYKAIQIGPTRELRAPGFANVAPGELGYFVLTPTQLECPYVGLPGAIQKVGELRDWKGRVAALVELGQSDDVTICKEVWNYMEPYLRALHDLLDYQSTRDWVFEQQIQAYL